ncbi:MAG: 6-phosphogluconolactonase [Verrucomicrobiota bacterium]
MNKTQLISFQNADELVRIVAAAWLKEVAAANHAGQPHYVALSGGRITLKFFAAVIALSRAQNVSLANVHFFWADDRCVPPDDQESSFGAANESFFRPLGITPDKIHRVRGELSPERAAEEANAEVKRVVPLKAAGQPVLDLIFLGMGEDAHVASLFPRETEAERANPEVYRVVTNSPKPPPNRVTLGYPAIAAAKNVWVLASGAGKEAALRDSIQPGATTPLGRVLQMRSQTRIFTDIKLSQQG